MKPRHLVTNFVTPLLLLALTISASNMATAQNGANQNLPAGATQQEQDERQGAQSGPNERQSPETADDVQPDTDCIDLGSDTTANANGAENPQRSPEAIAQAERERDDCLDLLRNANGANEDSQGEDSDNTPTSDTGAGSPAAAD